MGTHCWSPRTRARRCSLFCGRWCCSGAPPTAVWSGSGSISRPRCPMQKRISSGGSQTLRNEVALDQATIPALCSPARRRPRRYGTGEQADGKLPDYGPGRQAGICAAIWACGCTLRCSQGRWYLKGTAPLSEHQPGGSQCRGGGRNPFKGTAIRHQSGLRWLQAAAQDRRADRIPPGARAAV